MAGGAILVFCVTNYPNSQNTKTLKLSKLSKYQNSQNTKTLKLSNSQTLKTLEPSQTHILKRIHGVYIAVKMSRQDLNHFLNQ